MAFLDQTKGQELFSSFLERYKLSSFKVYKSEIKQFFSFYDGDIYTLSETDIVQYRDSLVSEISASSLSRKISILSKFFSYLEKHLEGFKNPISSAYGGQIKYQTDYQNTDKYESDLKGWLGSLHARDGTKETYRINVNSFFRWFKKPVKDITPEIIKAYKEEIISRYEQSTVWLKIVALNSFLKYKLGVEKAGLLISFSKLGLLPPKKDKGYYQVLNEQEIKSLLEQPDNSLYGCRNKAILWLMCTYGLRANEICKLKHEDFEQERVNGQQKLWIRDRKGKASNRADTAIILNGKSLNAMDEWLSRIKSQVGDEITPKTPVFNHFFWDLPKKCIALNRVRIQKKMPLTVRAIQDIIKLYVKSSGIKRTFKVTPHALRHTALTLLAKAGVELVDLKYLAGHQDLSTPKLNL